MAATAATTVAGIRIVRIDDADGLTYVGWFRSLGTYINSRRPGFAARIALAPFRQGGFDRLGHESDEWIRIEAPDRLEKSIKR
jgi:hypothetical protein